MLNENERNSLSKEDLEILRQHCRDTKIQLEKSFDELILRDPMQGDYAVELARSLILKLCKLENKDVHINLLMTFEHLIQHVCLIAREQDLFEEHVQSILRSIELSKSMGRSN